MIRLMLAAAAALLAFPGAARAQDWIFSQGQDDACFAMTFRGQAAFGFQAPAPGKAEGAFVVMAPSEAADPNDGPGSLTLGVSGKLAGPLAAESDPDPRLLTWFVNFEPFGELDRFPDAFQVKAANKRTVLFDSQITGFRAALARVRQCVADRP